MDSIYPDTTYDADTDARMSFYIQMHFIMTDKAIVGNRVVLKDGADIFTLCYQAARFVHYYSNAGTATWNAHRVALGFGLFNRTCAPTDRCYALYGSKTVADMPGNDISLR